MQIKNIAIKNLHITSRPLQVVGTPRFNATSQNNWAGTTATGSPALTDSKYLKFTGSEYLTTDTIATNSLTNNDVTYEFWLRTTGTNSGCLLSLRGDGGYYVSAVEISDTTLVPGYWAGSNVVYQAVPTGITRDVWQHYTVTYNTATSNLKTYYNGNLAFTANLPPEVNPRDYNNASNEWFQLFAYEATNFGHGAALVGDLGEFRLYTRALTDAEVNQNFRATRSRWLPEPTGLTSADPSTSAYAIKQAYPSSPDGLYWIQNANINSGNPVQVYCDMTTQGGGWTLIVQNNYNDWNTTNALLRNQTSAPATLVPNSTYGADGSANYSILSWADSIKRSAGGFDFMIEIGTRGALGGVWTANSPYSFVDQADGNTNWGSDVINGTDGFHQNITELHKFGSWSYNDDGMEHRMPWYNAGGVGIPGILTTTHNDSSHWWGTLIQDSSQGFNPSPWDQAIAFSSTVVWYWVR